jgi:glyoxylate reductase
MLVRPKVFVSQIHPGNAVSRLREQCEVDAYELDELPAAELLARLKDKDAVVSVVTNRLSGDVISALPNLMLIANAAVGYDNIDVLAASDRGIPVINTPGVLDDTTADLAFALMLAVARRIVEADRFVRADQWKSFTPELMLGTDVHGKTIGIIGLGRIGQSMARRARGFNMDILYTQRNRAPKELEEELKANYASLATLLQRSDFVTVHCPLTANTRNLLGARALSLMQKHAILINTARGPIVEEAALIKALQSGTIAGAGLDVFQNEPDVPRELLSMNNVVVVPHIGSSTYATRAAMANLAVDGLLKAFSGEMPRNLVNPQVWDRFLERLSVGARTVT